MISSSCVYSISLSMSNNKAEEDKGQHDQVTVPATY